MFEKVSSIKPSHASDNVEEALGGVGLPVPSLPQVEDGLGGTGPRGEEGNVSVDIESLRQHPPVISQ